jgi:CBS domain-containing protein
MRACDVMTPDPVCISLDASIAEAIRLMSERSFSGLPVVDADGSLVGIVTEGDLLRRIETGTQHNDRRGWNLYWARGVSPTSTNKQPAARSKT